MQTLEQIRQDSWEKAIHCLATSYIFQQKSIRYGNYLRYNSILGLIVPLLLGAVAATYGANSDYLKLGLIIVAPFSVAQVIISGLALANKWEQNLSYSLESQTENRILSDDFKSIAKYPPSGLTEAQHKFDLLITKDNERTKQDEKVVFGDKENRKGLRYALMILQISCVVCQTKPLSMTSSDCTNALNTTLSVKAFLKITSLSNLPNCIFYPF